MSTRPLGRTQKGVYREDYKRMTETVVAGEGDFFGSDYVRLLHRQPNPGRSREVHAMTGRIE